MAQVQGDTINIHGGHFVNIEKGQPDVFGTLDPHIAPSSFFNANDQEEPARCHPGTRERILDNLTAHLDNTTSNAFVWTHGPAGVGKTAVMRTLCDQFDAKKQLLASFFFFKSDNTRNSGGPFVPTLAYHLCREVQELRAPILDILRKDPGILKLDIETQARTLLIEPILRLSQSSEGFPKRPPQAIVVDGLDECDPEFDRNRVVRVLGRLSASYPSLLLIFITSRPHFDIRTHFESPPLQTKTTQETIYHDSEADADIRNYLTDEFNKILQTHRFRGTLLRVMVNGRWPSLAIIDLLVDKASGQFIFAVTIIRFVRSDRFDPAHRLRILLGHLEKDDDDPHLKPFEPVDKLYQKLFATLDSSCLQAALDTIAISIIYPFSVVDYRMYRAFYVDDSSSVSMGDPTEPPIVTLESLGILLSNRATYCHELVANLEALVEVIPAPNMEGHHTIRPFHKSLEDFLTSYSRAGPVLFIPRERPWEILSAACFQNNFWHEDPHVMSIMLWIPPSEVSYGRARAAWLDRGSNNSRLLALLKTPKAMSYDYSQAVSRVPRREDSAHVWSQLGCMRMFVTELEKSDTPALKGVCASHRMSFQGYLQSLLPVYKEHLGLWALLLISSSPRGRLFEMEFELTSRLISALSEFSPELVRQDRERGFGATHALAHYGGPSFKDVRPEYWARVEVARAILRLGFGDGACWAEMLYAYMKNPEKWSGTSEPVLQVLFSKLSLEYVTAGYLYNPDLSPLALDIQAFLDAYPDAFDDDCRKEIAVFITEDDERTKKNFPIDLRPQRTLFVRNESMIYRSLTGLVQVVVWGLSLLTV